MGGTGVLGSEAEKGSAPTVMGTLRGSGAMAEAASRRETGTRPLVSVLVVSYNVREHLERCLASVEACAAQESTIAVETIVVDNASRDGSAEMVRAHFPGVRLMVNGTNVGFTCAVNQGLAVAQGAAVLLLNPDAELMEEALGALWGELQAHRDVAVVGPKVLNSDGTVQPSRRTFPDLTIAFVESTILQRVLGDLPALRRYYCRDLPEDEPQDVDWLTGACLLVRREAIEQVGGLDERFFMYFEEVDWCWRMRRAGWRVRYQPAARVVHHSSRSADQDVTRRHIHFNTSKWRFYAKHYGSFWGQVVRWFLWATFGYQLLEESLKLLFRHKPELRRERVRSYLQVLRSGLT
jgi:N-acetylglucosaminyl-diphospho-decaprenol L-rhamnosyltransferase